MEGFLVYRWYDRWNEGISYMANLIHEEKLKAKETVVEGFDKMPEAFIGLLETALRLAIKKEPSRP